MQYIITWNSGYGNAAEVVEAENMEEAEQMAQDSCRQEFEDNATYEAVEYTEESAEDLL